MTTPSVQDAILAQLEGLVVSTRDRFLTDVKDYIEGARKEKLLGIMDEIAGFRLRATMSVDKADVDKWLEAEKTAVRRLKTVAAAERVVATDKAAGLFAATWKSVVSTLAEVGKIAISAAVSGLVQNIGTGERHG